MSMAKSIVCRWDFHCHVCQKVNSPYICFKSFSHNAFHFNIAGGWGCRIPPLHFENRIANGLVVSKIDVMPVGHFGLQNLALKTWEKTQMYCNFPVLLHQLFILFIATCWVCVGEMEFLNSWLQPYKTTITLLGGGAQIFKNMFLVKISPWFFHFPLTTRDSRRRRV